MESGPLPQASPLLGGWLPPRAGSRAEALLKPFAALACLAILAALLRERPLAARHLAVQPDGTVRVAVLSDTHVAGPQYGLNGENGQLDNASILKTQQRLWRVVQALNAVRPAPQLALFGGDIVHNGLERLRELGLNASGLARLFDEPASGYSIAAGVLAELRMDKLFAWGNHDKLLSCGDPAASASRGLSRRVMRHYFGAAAAEYSARDVGPHWKVVALNSMLGHTWDPSDRRCNGVLSSYGEEQLRWLDGQLAEGKHTVIIMHFPLPSSVLDEVPAQPAWRDLRSVLTAHRNVRLVVSGHCHKGFDWESLFPFPALTVPSTRYSPQNFFLLDLRPDGSFSAPDAAKNRGGGRCSDWWSYDGEPRFVAEWQPRDAGDCGFPAAGQEAAVPLPPVLSPSTVPKQSWFNPERSCQFVLGAKFLEACRKGATSDCCDVVESQFFLTSSAPFELCLCQPSFWRAAVDWMRSRHAVDLAAVLGSCVADRGKLIAYRGGPATWCPSAE